MTISRRGFMAGSMAAALATAMSACGSDTKETGGGGTKDSLTMVTWGGTTDAGFKKAWATPFTKKTGIPVKMTAPVDYAKYLAQVKNKKITWNWVDFEGWFCVQHKDLWVDLPDDVVGDRSDYIPLPGRDSTMPTWGQPSGSYSFAIAHRTDKGSKHPTSWEEFFDPSSIPGKRSVYNWPFGMLEVALLGDGVDYKDLYPLDVERALGKLDKVRGHLVFWNSGAELQQQLSSGAAPFAFAWNNRVAALARQGQPVAIEWAENLQDGGWDVVAKADPLKKETLKLLAFGSQAQVQADVALATGYSPPTKAALDAIPEKDQHWYSATEDHRAAAVGSINLDWWAKNFDSVVSKWNDWASG